MHTAGTHSVPQAVFQAISASSAEADRVVKGIVVLQCAMGRGGDFAAHLARLEIASLGPCGHFTRIDTYIHANLSHFILGHL